MFSKIFNLISFIFTLATFIYVVGWTFKLIALIITAVYKIAKKLF